jgi:hypothetical protein
VQSSGKCHSSANRSIAKNKHNGKINQVLTRLDIICITVLASLPQVKGHHPVYAVVRELFKHKVS